MPSFNSVKAIGSAAIAEIINNRPYKTIDELLLMAEGKSILNLKTEREGLVIRSHDRKISFKAISNKFLLNEK